MSNVLLAIDCSLYGKAISDFVANHRWSPGTNFKMLHVLESENFNKAEKYSRESASLFLSRHQHKLQQLLPTMNISTDICDGSAKEEILAACSAWPADMVIVGSHGLASLQRFARGSVSLAVMLHAQCSVLVVRLSDAYQTREANLEVKTADSCSRSEANEGSGCY